MSQIINKAGTLCLCLVEICLGVSPTDLVVMSPLLKGEEKWNMSLQGTEDGETPTFKMKVPSQMLSYVLME